MSIDLYPDIVYGEASPDLASPDFEELVDSICEEIHDSCKGLGTDEDRLIDAMARNNGPARRTMVSRRYPEKYDKDLQKLIRKECRGDFELAMELLALPPDEMEAYLIRKATKGAGTNEKLLYTIMCGRSNKDMEFLRKACWKYTENDLGSLLKRELRGDLEDFMMTCLQGVEETFDPEVHTAERAKEDAEKFHEAGEGRWGTDEMGLFKLLCFSPPEHLNNVNSVYTDKYDVTLFKAMENELRSDVEDAVLYALGMKLKPYETVAKLIKDACKGVGTDELLLTATIIRYQTILPRVCDSHNELYDKAIPERIEDECRGDYKNVLLAVYENAHYFDYVFENHRAEDISVYWIGDVNDGPQDEEEIGTIGGEGGSLTKDAIYGHTFVFRDAEKGEEVGQYTVGVEGAMVGDIKCVRTWR